MPRKEYATSTTSYLASFDFVAKSNDEGGLVSISKPVASVQNDLGKFIRKDLLNGEELKIVEEDVIYKTHNRFVYGHVGVTNYRLRFAAVRYPNNLPINGLEHRGSFYFDVNLGSISSIEKLGYSNIKRASMHQYGVLIVCKDMRNIRFLHAAETHGRRALYDCLKKYAFPYTNKLPFFAYLYKQNFVNDGWTLFRTEREFRRQHMPKTHWTLTRINSDYEFAGTYPSLLAVPAQVFQREESGEEFLRSVAKYRSKQRIPVLSWIDHCTYAAICRSSQPLIGLGVTTRKLGPDEEYIQMIINANPNGKHLVILDARPSVNAKANRVKGGGYEEEYPRCTLQFMDIQNIHSIRRSMMALKLICFPHINHKTFNEQLQSTHWLVHLKTILDASAFAVDQVRRFSNSVLVHCSDGWDRTAQITSLALLQLDPYYRTIEGFAALIEKEWASFGHKFGHRIGHGEDKPMDSERAPIFVQFIDCAWQLYNQYTAAFEFNSRLLRTILDELYSCRFGTFLYNTEKERRYLEVRANTISLWSFILDNRQLYTNPEYRADDEMLATFPTMCQNGTFLTRFWSEYYCRYNHHVILPDEENELELSLSAALPPQTSNNVHEEKNGHVLLPRTVFSPKSSSVSTTILTLTPPLGSNSTPPQPQLITKLATPSRSSTTTPKHSSYSICDERSDPTTDEDDEVFFAAERQRQRRTSTTSALPSLTMSADIRDGGEGTSSSLIVNRMGVSTTTRKNVQELKDYLLERRRQYFLRSHDENPLNGLQPIADEREERVTRRFGAFPQRMSVQSFSSGELSSMISSHDKRFSSTTNHGEKNATFIP